MGTILKNIVQFTGLVVGVPVSLPHELNVNGQPVAPQLGGADAGGFTVTADETDVTVTRTAGATSGDVNVYVEFWHTIEALTPPGKLIGLTPFFFAGGGGGGGGGAPLLPVTPVLQGDVDLTAGMTNLFTTNLISTPFNGTLPLAASVPNGTLLAVRHNDQDGNGMAAAQVLVQGGDKVDTNNSFDIDYSGGNAFIFVSDGVSNWWCLADFINPGG